MDRHEHVRIVQLREVGAREEVDGRRAGPGQQHRGARALQQLLGLVRHGEGRDRLPQPRRPLRSQWRMAGVEHDGAAAEGVARIDRRRAAHLHEQVAPLEAGAVAPHPPRQLQGDRHFVRRRLRVGHAGHQGIGSSVLHPVDIGGGAIDAEGKAPLLLRHQERELARQGHAQRDRRRPRLQAHRSYGAARRRRAGSERHGVRGAHPCYRASRELQPRLIVPAPRQHRRRTGRKEPVVGTSRHGPAGGEAVGGAGVRGVVV